MQIAAPAQDVLPLDAVKARAEAIRVTLKELARDAGLDPSTPYRLLKSGGGMHVKTALGLTGALVAAERRVFKHLRELHPEWASEPSNLGAA